MKRIKLVVKQAVKLMGLVLGIFLLNPMVCNAASPNNKGFLANIPLGIFMVLLLVVLFWGLKVSKRGEVHEDAFSLRISKGIQGFCAIGIILHHLAQAITNDNKIDRGIINFMCSIGVFFVGIFFFLSGYGLYTSLKNKPNYMKGFLRKRLSTILVPFYVGNFIYVLMALLTGQKFSAGELVSVLTGWVLLNMHFWYLVEIVILYIVFYLLFRFLKDRLVSYILLGAFIAGFIVVSLRLGHNPPTAIGAEWLKGEWWYSGTTLFLLGILFAKFYNTLIKYIQKFYWILLPLSLIGSVAFFIPTEHKLRTGGYWYEWPGYPGYLEKAQTLAVQFPMILCMVTAFLLITLKLQFRNKMLDFLGKISLELYIIHNLFLTALRPIQAKSEIIYIISVYILSICAAVLLNVFDRKIISLLTGKKAGSAPGGAQ